MALTPADVHNQQFSTVRMRTGYDMDEVDAFLDVVEAEVARLLAENDDLRGQLTQAQSRALAAEQRAASAAAPSAPPAPPQAPVESEAEVVEAVVVDEVVVDEVVEVVAETEQTSLLPAVTDEQTELETVVDDGLEKPVDEPEVAVVAAESTTGSVSEQAVKILEIAQRTADETLEHARSEASQIVAKARTQAAEITADLESDRIALESQVGQLRTFERNYRTALRDHIAGQLAEFDRAANREESLAGPAPALTAGDDPTPTSG